MFCSRIASARASLDGPDDHVVVGLADLVRVVVEQSDDPEPPVAEPPVFEQGPAEVAQANQGQRPVAVDPQDAPERGAQLLDPVADPGIAELAEEGEILADLGVIDRQGGAELAARDRESPPASGTLRAGGGKGSPGRPRPWGPACRPRARVEGPSRQALREGLGTSPASLPAQSMLSISLVDRQA